MDAEEEEEEGDKDGVGDRSKISGLSDRRAPDISAPSANRRP